MANAIKENKKVITLQTMELKNVPIGGFAIVEHTTGYTLIQRRTSGSYKTIWGERLYFIKNDAKVAFTGVVLSGY